MRFLFISLLLLSTTLFSQRIYQRDLDYAPDMVSYANLVKSISHYGEFVAVGAHREARDANGYNSLANAGAVYIYKITSNDKWKFYQKIVPSDREIAQQFGYSVSLHDSTLVVGATGGKGKAYVFSLNSSGDWIEKQTLASKDGNLFDQFGYAVKIKIDTLVVSAINNDFNENDLDSVNNCGAVYIYRKNSSANWEQKIKVSPSKRYNNGKFGYSIDFYGDKLIVGAPYAFAYEEGQAYIFDLDSNSFFNERKLEAIDRYSDDRFGTSVAITNGYAIVGAPHWDKGSLNNVGAVYVYKESTNYSHSQRLDGDFEYASVFFGHSMDVESGRLIVGAYGDSRNPYQRPGLANEGSIFVYQLEGSTWGNPIKVIPDEEAPGAHQGRAFSLHNGTITSGALYKDSISGFISVGAFYYFEYCDTTYTNDTAYSCAGDSILINANYVKSDTIINELLLNQYGCDSIVTKTVLFNHDTMVDLSVTICFGDSILINGEYVILPGTYNDTTPTWGGCDSITKYTVIIDNFNTTRNLVWLCGGRSVFINGNEISESGIYSDTLTANNGCDSIVFSLVEVMYSNSSNDSDYLVLNEKHFDILSETHADFGSVIKLDGNVAVVGAPSSSVEQNGESYFRAGSFTIFQKDSLNNWKPIQKINNPNPQLNGYFGSNLVISGDLIFVGLSKESTDLAGVNELINAGGLYVYKKENESWGLLKKFTLDTREAGDKFASSVNISNNSLIIGSSGRGKGGTIYIYSFDEFGSLNKLHEVEPNTNYTRWVNFGSSASIMGDYLFVGASNNERDENDSYLAYGAGAIYVYKKNNGTWEFYQKIISPLREESYRFGTYLYTYNNQLIAPCQRSGTLYFYEINQNGDWAIKQEITKGPQGKLLVAESVAVFEGKLIIGRPWAFYSGGHHANLNIDIGGAIEIYSKVNGDWEFERSIKGIGERGSAEFGVSLATNGEDLLVGAPSGVSLEDQRVGKFYNYHFGQELNREIIACHGQDVYVNNSLVTQAGMYSDTLINLAGCDSIVNKYISFSEPAESNIEWRNDTLKAIDIADEYQWLNCTNGFAVISNETDSLFVPENTGEYALEVTLNECKDTSACESFIITSTEEKKSNEFYVAPNISSDIIKVYWLENCIGKNSVLISLIDNKGNILSATKSNNGSQLINISSIAPGTYFVKLVSECEIASKRFVKIN